MSTPRPHRRRFSTLLIAALAACLVSAAAAVAAVSVYSNDFSSAGEARELRGGAGKSCSEKYLNKQNAFQISVKGRGDCAYSPPVAGDSDGPDLTVTADAKLGKDLPKSLGERAYLSVSVRGGYTLRVFPQVKRYELVRRPNGGGSDFPAEGREPKIERSGRNTLALTAKGDQVVGKVNGKTVARVTDADAAQVDGRGVAAGAGSTRGSKRGFKASLAKLKVAVPGR